MNFTWQGFTLDHWQNAFGVPRLFDSLVTSLQIAFIASAVATLLGTLIALALIWYVLSGLIPWIFLSVWSAGSLNECREIMMAMLCRNKGK